MPADPLSPAEDAFGRALLDHLAGRSGPDLMLLVDDGHETPAMGAAEFFAPPAAWSAHELGVLADLPAGPVLDLGAGAGRHALYLQERGHSVTAVDLSPGAVEVCRARGVGDARLSDLTDPPEDERWAVVLLMCGNLGLAGTWDGTRTLLTRLASSCVPGAVLVTDSVDPTLFDDERAREYQRQNTAAGRHIGEIRLRLRYGAIETPWFPLLNVPAAEVRELVAATGWDIEVHDVAGVDHYLRLRRS